MLGGEDDGALLVAAAATVSETRCGGCGFDSIASISVSAAESSDGGDDDISASSVDCCGVVGISLSTLYGLG